MDIRHPTSWREALEIKATHPEATPIAGGTDLMVELNFDRRRPTLLLDLTGIAELATWSESGSALRLGAGLPYTRLISQLSSALPGLAIASRTIGSPQIRNRGTLGGNLGSASPAGDGHPPLVACGARIELTSMRGTRILTTSEFFTGPKRNALAEDELIAAVHVAPATGPQQFSKIGTRNAMVIAVCAFALVLHTDEQRVGTGIGSAAPTPRAATAAEEFLNAELASSGQWHSPRPLPHSVAQRFSELVAGATAPIDDVRGSSGYRRHALQVMARRTLDWVWAEHCSGGQECA